jgi:NADPH2:quinone reductase
MMKAVYLIKTGPANQALDIREIDTPEPKKGQVRIKVECFGLNYADVMARNGLYDAAPKIPCILGYEVVGTIDQVGAEGNMSLIGNRVVAFTRFGGYAEYAITSEEACAEIGEIDAGEAAAIAVQYATAYYMAVDAIRLHKGNKVLIHAGAGGVGTALIQLCKLAGCIVFANAGSDEKLEYMKGLGADFVINYRKEDYETFIKKELKGEKLDATFNPIAGSTFKKDMKLLGAGGKLILFGGSERSGKKWGFLSTLNFVRKMGLMIPIGLVMGSKSVIGVNMLNIGDNHPEILKRCMDEVIQLMKDKKIQPHVGARYNYRQVADAHELLGSRDSLGKIVVYWETN